MLPIGIPTGGPVLAPEHPHDPPGIPVVTQDDDYVHAPGQEVIHI